ncbi:hypothetical protein Dsin_022488 [Dipteronia sinensis]|uniref:Reverse transcriptase domain-containing protein n=1 Tax=Dipteronia sinensis TaxID=43782 RepID=A0AAE0DZU6_9ROSI|nr:hypothetical protein Dsin_022488 [Dipteronia sinensis]
MEYMGFGDRWRGWICNCISTPLLSVLVNGSPTSQFCLERGLRQGDPLSHFLFNIVVEGLSCLIIKAANLGMLQGEDFGGNRINISHLQFADDTMLFLKPKVESLISVKRILRCFELVSGLKINFHKSNVVRVCKKSSMERPWVPILRCKASNLPVSYLGLPLGSRPGSKIFWRSILDKMEKKLAPWKCKFSSKSRRLTLIKAVIASIPTYFMSVFKMPSGIAQEIEKIQRSFFFLDGSVKRKLHAIKWETVQRSKKGVVLGLEVWR